ncbi:MAG: tRNA (adenosine(37)-N6)-threonylcarbamoyltransferase complex ATPase subunit type 1 TsaE [Proteobacteria bacterium]|nr:tRNA (adenosine(37)-N6)-threonylcarbamoyltransferase complex ATPase subunit type 1 TsaE [Pseudomonadota bacterium]
MVSLSKLAANTLIADVITGSCAQTQNLGEKIGKKITNRTIITLSGELGSGKTSFVQGLANGLEVPARFYVTSPTYSIIHEYPGRISLFHIDLYRLTDKDDIYDTGLYEILDSFGVFAIEWPDLLKNEFPAQYLSVHIEITGDDTRKIQITAFGDETASLIIDL